MSAKNKIIAYLGFVVSLFFVRDLTVYLVMFAVISILLCRLPFKSIKKGWVPISLFMAFTFISNVLLQHGKVLLSAGPFVVTDEGLKVASLRAARVFFMIAGAKILTATAGTESLVKSFCELLKPLERLGIPVSEFSSTTTLAVRYLPRIRDQISTGYRKSIAGGDIRGFWNRARVLSLFLIPLFVKSIQSPERFLEDDPNRKE